MFFHAQQLKYNLYCILLKYCIFYCINAFPLQNYIYILLCVQILKSNFLGSFLIYFLKYIAFYNNVLYHINDFFLHEEIVKCIFLHNFLLYYKIFYISSPLDKIKQKKFDLIFYYYFCL